VTRAAALIEINHPIGLHARPAVKLTKLAKTFEAAVRLRAQGQETWVDAKSIVKVMALKLRTGTSVEVAAEGADAEAALDAVRGLIQRNFDEDA
jgi:phosphocarrier protein